MAQGAQPDAVAARRKLEMLVRTMEPVMEGVDRMIRRRRMLTPARRHYGASHLPVRRDDEGTRRSRCGDDEGTRRGGCGGSRRRRQGEPPGHAGFPLSCAIGVDGDLHGRRL
ncbi:hypothetical protein PVAP13_5KG681107 [Panicum virgatum]|uniref:Uncharacterized protein n=1 Tax=Panicum virgatum TaxID=38727 RepID=A0A8T0SSA3_PANVG|nr:hypothetical protein PVAP13_5KG681107 [Panicum virgatum]